MHEVLPITLGQATKAARGYALLDGAEPQPAKATLTGLLPTMTARHAFAVAARNCLAQMRGNEASARLGRDPEGIHQLRVGLRRLRALVNAYRDALAPAAHEFLSRELRWLQQELNPARDWDVFIATTLEPITRRMPGLEACLEAAKRAARPGAGAGDGDAGRPALHRLPPALLPLARHRRLGLGRDRAA